MDDLFDIVMRAFQGVEVRIPTNEVSLDFTPELLEGRVRDPLAAPTDSCRCCVGRAWWRLKPTARRPAGRWTCARCHPPLPPPEAIETVTVAEGTP